MAGSSATLPSPRERLTEMRLAVLSQAGEPADLVVAADVPVAMASALEVAGHEVSRVQLPATPVRCTPASEGAGVRPSCHRPRPSRPDRPEVWEAARLAGKLVAALDVDALLLPRGAALVSHLRADAPLVHLPDSAPDGDLDVARRAMARADLVVFATRNDAAEAVRAGNVEPQRSLAIPWGADITPPSELASRRQTVPIHMLLVAADWTADGADVALGTMVELQRRGQAARLTVVGCMPPSDLDVGGLVVLPGFDRRHEGHRRRLSRLYGEASLMVLPSREAAAAGLAREAMAHGLVFVASDAPAHRELAQLAPGCTVVPAGARPATWADAVARTCLDPVAHARSCRAVQAAYRSELDWARWADRLVVAVARIRPPINRPVRPRR